MHLLTKTQFKWECLIKGGVVQVSEPRETFYEKDATILTEGCGASTIVQRQCVPWEKLCNTLYGLKKSSESTSVSMKRPQCEDQCNVF